MPQYPQTRSTASAPTAAYQAERAGGPATQRELLRHLALSPEAHQQLAEECRRQGIIFLSTPFDEGCVELLDGLGVPAFKIASGELTNTALLARAAQTGKPLILSTGMASLGEVQAAVDTIRAHGCRQYALPAPIRWSWPMARDRGRWW